MPPAAELVADKGYDSKALRDWLAERGTTAVIPPRKNRKVQYHYDKDTKQVSTPDRTTSPDYTNPRRRPTPEAYNLSTSCFLFFRM